MNYSKEIGEKKGVHFHSYELVLKEEGLEHISFNREEKKTLSLKDNKLVPKHNGFNIENFGGFKEFIFYNEKVIPGNSSGKNIANAKFEVNSKLYKPKILSKNSLLIKYHFIMNISPDIGLIEFDGQFIMDSFKKEMGSLIKYQQKKLKKVLQNIIAKAGIIHAEKIAKKYRIGFDANTALKELGLI